MSRVNIDDEFRQPEELVYLDHAAVAPWPRRAAAAVVRFAEENARRGAQRYADWLQMEERLRRRIKELLNAPGIDDIALLKNTSEALSVVAYGLDWRSGDNVVSCAEEFPSNRIVWESLAGRGVTLKTVNCSRCGDPESALLGLVDERTRLLAVSSVQYATGLRLDLARLGRFCRDNGVLFCVDAIQSLGALRLDVQAVQADFVMADGHKWMLGPDGLAVFYSRPEARERLRLNQYGWHMVENPNDFHRRDWRIARSARRFECGSPNMLGIHALEASLSLVQDVGMDEVERNVINNISYLIEELSNLPGIEILTPTLPGRRSGIVTFRPVHAKPRALHEHLGAHQVMCALRGGGIRLSPHFYTPRDKLDKALALVRDFLD